ncbi:MAG: GNAT family N-acetyltransferase, partial [Dehalococcoidia bacterium]
FEDRSLVPLLDCSFVALDGERPVSASLIALQDEQPLASYVFTAPAWKNRGLARALLECSMDAPAGAGYTTLALWVTAGNVPAECVYRALGFRGMFCVPCDRAVPVICGHRRSLVGVG